MLRKVAIGLLSTFLLTACSATAPQTPAPTAGPVGNTAVTAPKKVSLILDWYPNAVHSFVLAAQEQGYFKAEGLEVQIKMPAENPTDGIKLVGAGQDTFAFYYQPDLLLARNEGIPVVSAAAIVRRPLNGIMVAADSGIKSPKDLEGKQVGFPGIPLNESIVSTMVKTAGGDPAKVQMVDVGWDLIPALATKRVTGISGAYVNHEKPLLEKQGTKITYFAPGDFGVPPYYELILVTGEDTARKDPALIESFWKALTKGHEWVKGNQDTALKLLLEKQNSSFPLDADVEKASLEMLLPWMEEAGVKFGVQKPADWEKVVAWMKAEGRLKEHVKAEDSFVQVIKQ